MPMIPYVVRNRHYPINTVKKEQKKLPDKPFSEFTEKDWKIFYEVIGPTGSGYYINGYRVTKEEWEEYQKEKKEYERNDKSTGKTKKAI